MKPFTYIRVPNIDDATREITTTAQAKFIAGGTNLLDLMKENVAKPARLIDINSLPLLQIEETERGGLRLGALVTNADTAYHNTVQNRYPLLTKAILAGASPQLRNMATNGGNLLQRTRCYYFYDTATPCNKREPGSGCPAINGLNRIHAILGTSEHCIATHPSDMCVALAALEAVIHVHGPHGNRTIPIAEFHRLPGDTPQTDTHLEPNEIILAIELPSHGFAKHHAYVKVRDRDSYAFALVSVAVGLEIDGDKITHARLALGGVAHKPWRDKETEALLIGQTISTEIFQNAAAHLLRDAKGFSSNTFKIELAKRAIVRALHAATNMKQKS